MFSKNASNIEIIGKSRFATKYFMIRIIIMLLFFQLASYPDFFCKASIIMSIIILLFFYVLFSFFIWNFKLFKKKLIAYYNPVIFFVKPRIYNIEEIEYIYLIHHNGGKFTYPYYTIKLRGWKKAKTYSYGIASLKSMEDLVDKLKELGIDARFSTAP